MLIQSRARLSPTGNLLGSRRDRLSPGNVFLERGVINGDTFPDHFSTGLAFVRLGGSR
jgi:hypothetical protein